MKELELYEALPIMMEELGKKSVTIVEFNKWVNKYQKEHPDVYINYCRTDIGYAHECGYIWWEIRDEGPDFLHWQESIACPISGVRIKKYPNTVHYNKTKEMIQAIKTDVEHVLKNVSLSEDQRKIRENFINNIE